MPPDHQPHNADSPQRCDPIAEMFGLPLERRSAPQDIAPTTPARPGRLGAILSWLWQLLVDGFAAYGLAMYPCFVDPSELSDLRGCPRSTAAEPETESPAELAPSQYEVPERHPYQYAGQLWQPPRASDYRENDAMERGAPQR